MFRLGVDFGGTKIEAAVLDASGRFLARVRAPTPPDYEDRLDATRAVVTEAERQAARNRIELAATISAWRQALGLLPQ